MTRVCPASWRLRLRVSRVTQYLTRHPQAAQRKQRGDLGSILHQAHRYYDDEFRIEHPMGLGNSLSLSKIANDLTRRVTTLRLKDAQGVRPMLAAYLMLQADPCLQDRILFQGYFRGDDGRGVGALHQMGWSRLVALLRQPA